MSIEGQDHFFTIYFLGFVCFVLYLDKISGERSHDHWSSGFFMRNQYMKFQDDISMPHTYMKSVLKFQGYEICAKI